MDFTVNIYLRMIWEDARLAYSASNPNASVSLHSMKDKIWMPDIFFRNAKQVENHADPVPNILVKLRPTGRIYFSQKLKVRLWCLMDLRDFPMDCQICRIELGAYGSSVSEVRFHWHRANVTFEDDALQIPEFSQPHVFVQSCTKSFSVTGEFACLRANVRLRRAYGFYLMNTYAPFTLMVCISWISFWIDVRATPARVTIAFLTVLAVVTQNAGTQMTGMPRVSYVKAIDPVHDGQPHHEKELGEQPSRRRRRSCAHGRLPPAAGSPNGLEDMLMSEERTRKMRSWCYRNPRVNKLDYCSRFLFPLAYLVFQAAYWSYYLRDRTTAAPADCCWVRFLLEYQSRPDATNEAVIHVGGEGGGPAVHPADQAAAPGQHRDALKLLDSVRDAGVRAARLADALDCAMRLPRPGAVVASLLSQLLEADNPDQQSEVAAT
uniref:Neur_chan_LBD domain-containing protein n=1 Tax=Macrostomum lignano TaxID=282301 RepID=A0A1I8F4U3_9PLAT